MQSAVWRVLATNGTIRPQIRAEEGRSDCRAARTAQRRGSCTPSGLRGGFFAARSSWSCTANGSPQITRGHSVHSSEVSLKRVAASQSVLALAGGQPIPAFGLIASWTVEHFLIATTMLVVGLFAVLSWNSTFPDRRDVLILSPLPVPARTLFLA